MDITTVIYRLTAAGASTGSLSFEFASAEGEAGTVSKGLCALSPDGTLVASVAKTHLRVFELATMRVRLVLHQRL